jgi:Mn2+/Fe2+ NRAMP family transporter
LFNTKAFHNFKICLESKPGFVRMFRLIYSAVIVAFLDHIFYKVMMVVVNIFTVLPHIQYATIVLYCNNGETFSNATKWTPKVIPWPIFVILSVVAWKVPQVDFCDVNDIADFFVNYNVYPVNRLISCDIANTETVR